MSEPTISNLLREAAKKLNADFEYARSTSTHEGQKGADVERILIRFLNDHLPRRFNSTSGTVIDIENAISKQMDVIVYDALTSPVYRTSDVAQILPADNVAACIEVKTSLNKAELAEAYKNIASCKRLKKRPLSGIDRAATGSELITTSTLGVVFGFDSSTSLETLAENARELNEQFESKLWPDAIVILGKGVIFYGMTFPGEEKPGTFMPPTDPNFVIPAIYVHLAVTQPKDKELTLNRFLVVLLSHLTFFAYRVGTPPFDVALAGAINEVRQMESYQFTTSRVLKRVPDQLKGFDKEPEGTITLRVTAPGGQQVAILQYTPWQDGAVIFARGVMRLGELLGPLLPNEKLMTVNRRGQEVSSLLKLAPSEFRMWPEKIGALGNLTAEIVG